MHIFSVHQWVNFCICAHRNVLPRLSGESPACLFLQLLSPTNLITIDWWLFLILDFHINGIIEYEVLCVWLHSFNLISVIDSIWHLIIIIISNFGVARQCFKCFIYNDSFNLHSSQWVGTAIILDLLVRRKADRGQSPGSAGTVRLQSHPSRPCWPLRTMSAAEEHQPCSAPKDAYSRQRPDAWSGLMCLLEWLR